jgi:diguanylate cyclase (GGDEF)-like protein/PAS domain S-box-containing protein
MKSMWIKLFNQMISRFSPAYKVKNPSSNEKSGLLSQLVQIVEQSNDAFILFDQSLNIVFANNAITNVTGQPSCNLTNMYIVDFVDMLGLDLPDLLRELDWMQSHQKNSPARDITVNRSDGSNIDLEMRLEMIDNHQTNEQNFLIVLSNITERKQLENELHQLAFYDKLTGLPNRRMFMDNLQNLIKHSQRQNKTFAVFFMDLDDFKYINDSLGHEAGDELLKEAGLRLKEIFRNTDMVARLGGDEFTVTIENIKDSDDIDLSYLAKKLLSQLSSKPLTVQDRNLTVNTSIGIAKYPDNGLDSETLIKNADTAMYYAKRSGKNRFALFSEEMNLHLRQHVEMESDLKEAIVCEDQISMHYQPIVDLKTKGLVGVEALARWKHPEKGWISPIDFISVAEQSDLIIDLSDMLINIAFKQFQAWSIKNKSLYISINVSVKQFEKKNFLSHLGNLLNTYQINAHNIQLEFTESVMLNSNNETFIKFAALKELGFKIAIDDFGTGYSSLGYIHKLPIDVIKIDRSFVEEMPHNQKTRAIVATITKLSASLGIKTIAEGIETESQATLIQEAECNYAQGYLYSKPLNAEAFELAYLQS